MTFFIKDKNIIKLSDENTQTKYYIHKVLDSFDNYNCFLESS